VLPDREGRLERSGEIASLGRRGVFRADLSAEDHWPQIESILKKYADRPVSFADACLIRLAEIHEEPRIFTFDADFAVYRWGRNRKFERV
jgi:predicted nucleic acid-binding protein